jgi:hypothetical protein
MGNPLLTRGVVAHTETLLLSDHPVCGAKVGFAEIFLMPQPPLTRRGLYVFTLSWLLVTCGILSNGRECCEAS